MNDASEIRKANLESLLKNYTTQKEFADAIGMSPSQLGHLLTGFRGIGEKLARKIEANLRLSPMSLDIPPDIKPKDDVLINELVKPVEITAEELGLLNLLRDLSSIQRNKVREIAKQWKNENKVAFSELRNRYENHAHA